MNHRSDDDALPDVPEPLAARATVLEDIRIAEEQIARGEGTEHDEAMQQVLTRLRR